MGQSCWRNGVMVKSKFASPGRQKLVAGDENDKAINPKTTNNNGTIREDENEDDVSINNESTSRAFNLMVNKDITVELK